MSIRTIVSKLTTIGMSIVGGFFTLLGIGGFITHGFLTGIIILLAGLIAIPYVRDQIATITKKPRINGTIALLMTFVLLMTMGLVVPAPDNEVISKPMITPTPEVTATPTTTPTPAPTPDLITRKASEMLPSCTEIGDGTGWAVNYQIDDTNGTAEGNYYKDDRCVNINISVMADKNEAMIIYYDLHNQWGYDEYSPLEYGGDKVGELSMLRIYNCPREYGRNCIESGDGCFTTNNVVVIVSVEDYHVTPRDVGRYAGQIDI